MEILHNSIAQENMWVFLVGNLFVVKYMTQIYIYMQGVFIYSAVSHMHRLISRKQRVVSRITMQIARFRRPKSCAAFTCDGGRKMVKEGSWLTDPNRNDDLG